MSFTPVVRDSNSIVKSLLEFSKDRKLDVKTLDFELISHQTLMKREEDLEYMLIEDTKSITKADYLNPTTIFVQEYKIKIMSLKKPSHKIKATITTNKPKTKAILTIAKGSSFDENISVARLKDIIWAKKLRAGLFIDIFEPKLDEQLQKLIKIVPPNKAIPKDLKFSVALGIEPTPPVDAHTEFIFQEKNIDNDSIIDSVDKGDLILRYHKETKGTNGRSCNGKFLLMREPRVTNLTPIVDTTIDIQNKGTFVEYFANMDGYVAQDGPNFSISQTLKLENADFKSAGNIDGGDSSKDISVQIAHKKSHSEDAISSGVNINVKELNTNGSVGSNVQISTKELNIDAQTHKKSKIEVENSANVKLHRGDLVAKDATIDILESGKITAHHSIHIKKMLGGEAIAPIVKIDELLSNATIIASELIEITSLNGTNNKLIINPNAIESYHKAYAELEEKHKLKTKEHMLMQKAFNEKMKEHNDKIPRLKTFQQRVLLAQKSGKAPMKQDVIRIKDFKRNTAKLQEEQKVVQEHTTVLKEIEVEMEKMQNKDLHAKIISHTSYDGQSKVIFVNIKTKEEITHIPEGKIDEISLTLNADDERVIKLS